MDAIKNFIKDGVEYYILHTPCPICIEQGRPYFWKHDNCGGQMYIGDDAYVFCEKCKSKFPIDKCLFECPECTQHKTEAIIKTNVIDSSPSLAIAIAGYVAGVDIDIKWLHRFTSALIALINSTSSSV